MKVRKDECFREDGAPLLTVGIPAMEAAAISWLPIAGLARQTGVPVPWEIVICQEDDSVSSALIEQYRTRLVGAGCVRVVRVMLSEWVHLSRKWALIRDNAVESSEVFLLQGVDDYPHTTRLRSSWNALQDGSVDWFHWDDMLFYDCNFDSWSIFRGAQKPPLTTPKMGWTYHPCNPNMATRTKFLQYLPDEDVRRGVDGWFFYSIQRGLERRPVIASGISDEQLTGFGTTGFNSLSISRIKQGSRPVPPFFPYDGSLGEILGAEDASRLKELGNESRQRALDLLVAEVNRYDAKIRRVREMVQSNVLLRKLIGPARRLVRWLAS